MNIKNKPFLKWPSPIITPPEKRDRSRYCYFHKDYGHDTLECWAFKEQIKELIRQGRLKEFIEDDNIKKKPRNTKTTKKKGKVPIQIKTIFGWLSTKGISKKEIKHQAREVMYSYYPQQSI